MTKIDKNTLIKRLEESNIKYLSVKLDRGYECIVTERGGRIFGPFSKKDKYGILWISEVFKDSKTFKQFLKDGLWNVGGDRLWIAPELQFSVKNRNKFWETLKVDKNIDPGRYKLSLKNNAAFLKQKINLKADILAKGEVSIAIERIIKEAPNPIRELKNSNDLMKDVTYCGFEQEINIETIKGYDIPLEGWNLTQIYPKGYLYILSSPNVEYADYYEPSKRFIKTYPNFVRMQITGRDRYKVGFKSCQIYGRMIYLTKHNDTSCIIIKNFPNNPSSFYREEPPFQKNNRGFSLHVYNDDGMSGGFAEMECNMQSIGGKSGYLKSRDRVSTWIYLGEGKKLNRITEKLCGKIKPN